MAAEPKLVKEIFLEAAELPDETARAAFLDRTCGGDTGLRARVEALLQSHDPAGSFLGTPAAVIPDPEHAATRTFSHDSEAANTRTYGHAGVASDDEIPLGFLSPATRPDSLGRIGHYEVLQVLGQGGFGIVFRAFDDVLQRVVAVKVLAPQLAATSPARKRFLREARTSAAVRHENVVQVYEVGEAPLPYIAMEFIPGETLQQRLDRIGPIEAAEVVRLGRQIAEGLAAAHANDLIHRDIKPGNILLESGQQRVKITDFGLARAADDASISQSGIIAGTPMYMAPEQAKGDKLDQRADLFSLGSVLYQMASGRPPFRANGTVAVLKRVAEDTPRDIREITPETPQWLCDIISKLHEKQPADRFQTAREVAEVLADCEAQLKASAKLKDYSRIPRGKRATHARGGRNWIAVAVVMLLCAVALGAAVYAGVTVLFRGQPPTHGPTLAVESPTPGPVAPAEPLPPTFKNSIGMEFVIVPKGKSWLGGGKDKLGHKEVEFKDDFYLGKYEVTQEEWEKVMGENPSHFSSTGGGSDAVKDIPDTDLKRFPVESVSWHQCQIFVAKLNKLEKETGWVYRLPTEAEWEYACRGGPMSDKLDGAFDFYFTKPTNTLLPRQANVKESGKNRTCAVGSYQPNRLGLYDMHGNVWEWCEDEKEASERVCVGDGWESDSWNGKAGFRRTPMPASERPNAVGLRLARVPSGALSPDAKAPSTAANVLKDAVLLMNFEKDTFYEKDGKTYVRDLSGSGNDGLCENVVFTPEGKAGGGLACKGGQLQFNKSLINRQPNYTITLWSRANKIGANVPKEQLYLSCPSGRPGEGVFRIGLPPERTVHVGAWNRTKQPDQWGGAHTQESVIPEGEWYFLAVTLSRGGAEKGELRVTVNDKVVGVVDFSMQMVDSQLDGLVDMLGHQMIDCTLDEVAIFQRALTDQEIAEVRALGMKGTPLNVGKAPPAVAPFTDADVKRIAALPAAEQIEEVRKELMRRNRGFDGGVEHKIEDGVVTELRLKTDKVRDITPVRVFDALQVLDCGGAWGTGVLADLTPLQGMNLANLRILKLWNTEVGDAGLVHLKDCKNLTSIDLFHTQVGDGGLVHIKGCKTLTHVYLGRTKVSDAGMDNFKECKKLTVLWLHDTQVGDPGLIQFKGMPLTQLVIENTNITDLTPLQEMPLEDIRLTPRNITKGLEILRGMKSLKTIGIAWDKSWPAKEFWERYDKGEFGFAPLTDADVKRIAALPAAEQVEEVRKELVRRNPGFDGIVEHKIEGDAIVLLGINTDAVTDVSPVRVFNALRVLNLGGTATQGRPNGRLADLTPLRGMNLSGLTMLSLANTRIDDAGLAHFKDCKSLEILWLNCAPVTNAGVGLFKGCTAIKSLTLNNTRVDDDGLVHFKDCKGLTGLDLGGLAITDAGLAHFKDCKGLTHLVLYETRVTNAGLAHFKDCKDLTFLHLRQTGIGDTGLAHFKDCKKLTWVELAETEVTDAGLTYLAGVGELTHLNLAKAKVTAKGVEDLSKGLPKCKIAWDGGVLGPK